MCKADLFCLTETWIKPTTTPAELVDCTMPGYTLIRHPRTPRFQKSQNVGGGTAFLVSEPFSQMPSTISAYTSFEASAITLKLRSSKLTVFNVYRPPVSSNYAKPFSTFLEEFYSFLTTVNKPTRITATSATLIDNVITNVCQSQFTPSILYADISDHLPIIIQTDSRFKKKNFDKFQYRRRFTELYTVC